MQLIEDFKNDYQIPKEVGGKDGEGSAYGNHGNANLDLGKFHEAVEYYNKHLSIAKEVGNRAGEGMA